MERHLSTVTGEHVVPLSQPGRHLPQNGERLCWPWLCTNMVYLSAAVTHVVL